MLTQRSSKSPTDFAAVVTTLCGSLALVQAVQKLAVLAQAILKPMVIKLPQPLKFQDHRYESLC